jgi:hypothetical protein
VGSVVCLLLAVLPGVLLLASATGAAAPDDYCVPRRHRRRPRRDRRRPRRQPLVHRVRGRQGREDHTGRCRHRIRRQGHHDGDCQGQGPGHRRRHQLPREMQGNDRIRSEADTARERQARPPLRRLERSVHRPPRLHSSPESSGQSYRGFPQTPLVGDARFAAGRTIPRESFTDFASAVQDTSLGQCSSMTPERSGGSSG